MQAPMQVPIIRIMFDKIMGPELVLALQIFKVSNSFYNAKDKNNLKALLDAEYVISSIIKLVITLR